MNLVPECVSLRRYTEADQMKAMKEEDVEKLEMKKRKLERRKNGMEATREEVLGTFGTVGQGIGASLDRVKSLVGNSPRTPRSGGELSPRSDMSSLEAGTPRSVRDLTLDDMSSASESESELSVVMRNNRGL